MVEVKTFQGFSPYGNALLASACDAIGRAPDGQQEGTLNDRSFQLGRYVGGGLLDRNPTVEALMMAGLQMTNFDKNREWTDKEILARVTRAVESGMKQPLDGEEPFRFMDEVHRKFFQDPKLQNELEEELFGEEAKRQQDKAQQGQSEQDNSEENRPQPDGPQQPQDPPEHGRDKETFTRPPDHPWPVLNPDAMYGLAGDVVRAIEPHTESDPVALLVQFIAYFGNAVGRYPYYLVESDRHYPNLFAVLVGQSSKSRKGTAAGRIRELMSLAEPEWVDQCISSGLSSGEGVIWRVRDPVYKIKNGQRELQDEGVKDHRLLLDERELYQALTVMKREGNTLSRVIRDAWDRGTLQTITKHNPACATNVHISIVGHITEDELRQNLDHTAMMNGVANRFVFALVRRARILPHGGGDISSEVKDKVVEGLRYALGNARKTGRITMTPAAIAAWEAVYPELSTGHPGLLGAACGRAEAQVIRFALIYALMDGSTQVDLVHLRAAIALWDYCEQSARHIFGDLFGERVIDTILLALRQSGPEGMTRTQIFNLFSRNQSSSSITAALQKLAATGTARQTTRQGGLGRPTEVWVIK
jgi:hypothetical protein